jgi:histidine decarboxylase
MKNSKKKIKDLAIDTSVANNKETDRSTQQDVKVSDYVDPDFGPKSKPWSVQVPAIARSDNHDKYPDGFIIEPPSGDSLKIYNERSDNYQQQQKVLNEKYAQLPPDGQGDDHNKSLEIMENYYIRQRDEFIGYQCAEQFEISKDISPFLNMSLNNIGDPFVDGYFTVNAKQAERGVLDFFASIWHARWPSLPKPPREASVDDETYLGSPEYKKYKESYWGYVLSMGSTEGNLYAVLSARDYLSGFSLVAGDAEEVSLCMPDVMNDKKTNKYTPVAFYSEAAHYSLAKAVHAMQVKTFSQIANEKIIEEYIENDGEDWNCPLGGDWPESVPVDDYGRVKIDDLVKLVEFFARKGYAPFICFNYGTTFKGAYDNIPEACEKLKPVFKANNLVNREVQYFDSEGNPKTDYRRGYWVHVDGALGASLMPFVEMAVEHKMIKESNLAPCFDFRNDEVMSLVTSGHKWPDAPAPTGVYMTKNKYLITPVATPDYLGSADTTFAGSRSGLSAMILWNLIAKEGVQGLVKRAEKTMELCAYATKKFIELQEKLKDFDIWLRRAPNGGTSLIFRKPVDRIMFTYSLPIEVEKTKVKGGTRKQTYVHLFIFWDRNEEMIDNLISDLDSKEVFDPKSDEFIPTPPARKKKLQAANRPVKIMVNSAYKGFR